MAWELEFVNFMKNWIEEEMPEYIDVAFTSERSVEDELDRETYGDLATIAVSYVIMFAYITLALGQYSSISLTGFLIESKITLGLFGVMIVLLSVFASMGIFALIGVPATLIIFEIIPFLVLAVGVDNIFILVQTYRGTRGAKRRLWRIRSPEWWERSRPQCCRAQSLRPLASFLALSAECQQSSHLPCMLGWRSLLTSSSRSQLSSAS